MKAVSPNVCNSDSEKISYDLKFIAELFIQYMFDFSFIRI